MERLTAEKNRLRLTARPLQKRVQAPSTWLEKELDSITTELTVTMHQSPVWCEKEEVHAFDKDLAAVSGHPHHVVLRLVDRVRRCVQFHASPSTGRRRTLLTPPPLQAGTSR